MGPKSVAVDWSSEQINHRKHENITVASGGRNTPPRSPEVVYRRSVNSKIRKYVNDVNTNTVDTHAGLEE
jgi:hypothetical protein